jgi:signal transduction histidine kinase
MVDLPERNPALTAIYVAALILVVAIGILAAVRLHRISDAMDDLTNNLAADIVLSKEILNQVVLIRFHAHRYVNTQDQTDLDQFNGAFATLSDLLLQANEQITAPERVAMLERIDPAVEAYGEAFGQIATLIRRRQRVQSEVLDVQGLQTDDRLTALRMHVVSLDDTGAFLAVSNARNAFQSMRLNAARYMDDGDERYSVLFEAEHQQLQTALTSLEESLSSPAQRENAVRARAAADIYWEGFQSLRQDTIEVQDLFETELDVLEPEISGTASEIVSSVEASFDQANASSKRLVAQTRWVLMLTTAIAALTGVGLGVVFSRRLAERQQAERALRAARDNLEVRVQERTAELEQANEEIKHFAYIVSHDLRAPLVNLKGFSTELRFALDEIESVLDDARLHLDEEQQQRLRYAMDEDVPEALDFIESSVSRMDAFINAVLQLSRLGRRELHPEPIDMEALVDDALESLAHQIEERDVEVTVGALPTVVADRTSMEQIMGNLLDNALKYLQPERPGEIEITAERDGSGADEEMVTFHIRDNGRGIAEDDLHKVFAPFRRAGRQDAPGDGMGLPYVQTLVRRHGGRIWCESELGEGTTFTFTMSNGIGDQVERGDNVG